MFAIDTEFFNTREKYVNPVCCSIVTSKGEIKNYWVLSEVEKEKFIKVMKTLEGETFIAWNATAEGRFLISLGIDPLKYKWIDLFIEYRCLTNHNDALLYGDQLVNGKVTHTKRPPPKWERTTEDKIGGFKPTHSLAEATYKLTTKIRDTDHKNLMRDIIISGDLTKINSNKKEIMDYCYEDTKFLFELKSVIDFYYEKLIRSQANRELLPNEQIGRGEYMVITAWMETFGYPVDVEKVLNFQKNAPVILFECQRDINRQFPGMFIWKWKEVKFSMNTKLIRDWIWDNADRVSWEKTDGIKRFLKDNNCKNTEALEEKGLDYRKYLSLSLDAFTSKYSYRHSYPENNLAAQVIRFLKLKQSLNGFTPKEEEDSEDSKSFKSFIGSDGKVRTWFNPFGSQTSRSQPPSSSFLFLKPAWQRSLCLPKKGRAMIGFDYGSEEYLISALLSKCPAMIKNYADGDVYLGYGKDIGEIPKDATKQSHKKERDLFKPVVLAMSYLMSKYGLAAKLTEDTGHNYTEEQAQKYIDKFYEAYPELEKEQQKIYDTYYGISKWDGDRIVARKKKSPLKLNDGWYLWTDKPEYDFRSVTNFKTQGAGGAIMRAAVKEAVKRGLMTDSSHINITLHDALYMEYDSFDFEKIDLLKEAMIEGFVSYFPDELKEQARLIKLDGFTWSLDYPEDSEIITPTGLKIPCSNIYIDSRSEEEWEKNKKFFEHREESEL